jgi:hypothetical protein
VAVTTKKIEYSADGTTMIGRLALPDGAGKRPGVLIAHDGAARTGWPSRATWRSRWTTTAVDASDGGETGSPLR